LRVRRRSVTLPGVKGAIKVAGITLTRPQKSKYYFFNEFNRSSDKDWAPLHRGMMRFRISKLFRV
jgi:hypothetical protein